MRKSAIVFGFSHYSSSRLDAPGAVDRIVDYLKQNGIERIEAVFLTHGHVDHIIAMNEYRKQLPGEWKAYLGEPDLHIWYSLKSLYNAQAVRQSADSRLWRSVQH